jgi:hypothetical protein
MLGGLVQAGTKALGGERFSLATVMPTTLLVGYISFLAASGLYTGRSVSLGRLPETVGSNAGWAVLVVFGTFVISVLIRPLQIVLVWALEGYWNHAPILAQIEPFAVERHQRRRHTAEIIASEGAGSPGASNSLGSIVENRQRIRQKFVRQALAEAQISRYPEDRPGDDIRLMPTMLGNALRKIEDDAGDRYGLDFPAIAPRIFPVLSEKIGAEIARNYNVIEGGAALTTVFAVAAACSIPLAWRGDAWALTLPGALLFAALAHFGTLRAARDHGQLLATAVDLHRFDMIEKLHYRLPANPHEEREFNKRLSYFLSTDSRRADEVMRDHQYVHIGMPSPLPNGLTSAEPDGERADASAEQVG